MRQGIPEGRDQFRKVDRQDGNTDIGRMSIWSSQAGDAPCLSLLMNRNRVEQKIVLLSLMKK